MSKPSRTETEKILIRIAFYRVVADCSFERQVRKKKFALDSHF